MKVVQCLMSYIFLLCSLCQAARLDSSHLSSSHAVFLELENSLIQEASRGAKKLSDVASNITVDLARKAELAQKASVAQIADLAEVKASGQPSNHYGGQQPSLLATGVRSLESHLSPEHQKLLNHLGGQFVAYQEWKGQTLVPLMQIIGLPVVFLLCLFAKHNAGLCYNAFLLILLVFICWLNMSLIRTRKIAFAVLACLVLFQTLKVCLFKAFSKSPKKQLPRKQPGWDLRNFWTLFFDRCRDLGITEVYTGRITTDELSGGDSRVVLALPGLVLLQCALASLNKEEDGVEFPDGTKVDEMIHPVCQETCRFFSRVIVAYRDLHELGFVHEAERVYLEERALHVIPKSLNLGDVRRESQVNKAADALAAAVLELSQLSMFRLNMQRALQQVFEAPSEP